PIGAASAEPVPTATPGLASLLSGQLAGNTNVPNAVAEPVAARLPTDQLAALLARGDAQFNNGDVASARLFYERAAEGGDARAAVRLAKSYDPAFLARIRLNGVRGDAAVSAQWYRQARVMGAADIEPLASEIPASNESAI